MSFAVAESGVRDGADVSRLFAAAGFDAVLVGETLMRRRTGAQPKRFASSLRASS